MKDMQQQQQQQKPQQPRQRGASSKQLHLEDPHAAQ
jgi:hypothetical protein